MKVLLKPRYLDSESLRLDYFRKDIVKTLDKEKKYKLLDIGCSQLNFNSLENIESFGVDIKKSEVYDSNHFKICDLNKDKLPFPDNFFDIIIAGEIIEHTKRPFELIEEISRILKNKGVAYISTPNPHYYLEILKELFGSKTLDDKEHLNLFSRIHLVSYAKKCNLELRSIKRYKFWIPFIKLMILSVNTPRILNYQNIYKFTKK